MSVSNSHYTFENQIEVLKFQDPHLVLRILDFSFKNLQTETEKEDLLQYKEKFLFKTFLFDSQRQFLESNQNLSRKINLEEIEKTQENVKKKEDMSKFSIIGFLNLMENYRRNANFDIGSSISKKIVDETSVNKVLEYSKILYEKGNYSESKTILTDFFRFSFENKKNLSKLILALSTIFSINVLENNWSEIFSTFNHIKNSIDLLKNNIEEEFKKIHSDSAEKIQLDFRHILLFRSYLIHWSLFLLKDSKQGLEKFLNFISEENYLSLIESSFNYLYKYLVVIAIISKSHKNIQSLRHTFAVLSYEDDFTKLFNSIFEEFDVENTYMLIQKCGDLMKSDYFLCDYYELFATKCKELSIENHIHLNTQIDTKFFSKFFAGDSNRLKIFVENFILMNYSQPEIQVKDDVIYYKFKDTAKENQHILRVRELFDVTKNMIEIVKLNNI